MKKKNCIFAFLMAIVMMVMSPMGLWAQTQPSVGDGSSTNPYQINNAQEMLWFANYVNETTDHAAACAILMADIDLSTVCHAADEANGVAEVSWTPIAKDGTYSFSTGWTGTFDGNGKTISNLYINNNADYQCFICWLGTNSVVKNLKMANVNVSGGYYVAGVVASSKGTIQDVEVVSGTVTSNGSGVAGIAYYSTYLVNCTNRANVSAQNTLAAGITWYLSESARKCSNFGTITSHQTDVAGIVVQSGPNTSISDCANYGDIKANTTASSGGYPAGIISCPWMIDISNCANFGDIYVAEGSTNYASIIAKGKLNSVSGNLINSGELYVADELSDDDFPIMADDMTWSDGEKNEAGEYPCVSKEDLASGSWAFDLQYSSEETEPTWGQNITTEPKDPYPLIGATPVVYSIVDCQGAPLDDFSYSNTQEVVHNFVETFESVDATCTETGIKACSYCDACDKYVDSEGNVMDSNITPALGHTYGSNDLCTRCGAERVIEIGEGTTSSTSCAYYPSFKNSTTMTLYKGSEIDKSGIISTIAYNVNKVGPLATNELKIYMAMTDLDNLDDYSSIKQSDFSLVYSGNPTLGSETGWEQLTLDTPFGYDKTKNLLIAVSRKSDGYKYYYYYNSYASNETRTLTNLSDYDSSSGEFSSFFTARYISNENWYTNIQIGFLKAIDSYDFVDGTEYKKATSTKTLNYKRTFTNTTYNALYVPFSMKYSDWSDKADVYRILNIFENDKDDNGTVDEWVLRVVKLKEGESTKANTPYVIKPKAKGEMNITLSDVQTAAVCSASIWCASTDYKFVFTGNYSSKSIDANSLFFVSSAGGLQYADDEVTLSPGRWTMGIYDKDTDELIQPSSFNASAGAAKAIRIFCDDDEDTATGIHEISSAEGQQQVFSISGQRLSALVKGINIINGKKVLVK